MQRNAMQCNVSATDLHVGTPDVVVTHYLQDGALREEL